jgi:nucleoside-diphosphate-sugar epimerase
MVSGPPLTLPDDPNKLGETYADIWKIFSGQDISASLSPSWVDVRDVARIMIWQAENSEKANGERYLAYGAAANAQAKVDILRKAFPERKTIIKEGNPGEGYTADFSAPPGDVGVDASKAVKATGQGWIPFDKTVVDTAKAFEEKYL